MQTIRLAGWPGPWRLLQEGHIALRCVHTSLAINGAVDAHNFRDRIAIFIKIRVGSATHFVSTARVTFFLAADSSKAILTACTTESAESAWAGFPAYV
mmetsp:Transcript_8200/g.25562  ORF Transcript_8200/g.25562 Transcript_8200/m.25562 type:complete len:98 (+) Transcript_8200:1016-1309(+)